MNAQVILRYSAHTQGKDTRTGEEVVLQPGLRPGYRPIRGSGRHPITQLNVAGTSAGWVSRDPKALAEAREKLSLSFVIM